MKWYIPQLAPIAGINCCKIIKKEMGSEAASIFPKWTTKPIFTRVAGQEEVPNMVPVLDAEGNAVLDETGFPQYEQDGTYMRDIIERVTYPYLVLDGELVRPVTDAERALIDAEFAQSEQDRIQNLAMDYGKDVMILGGLLAEFGYTLPIEPDSVFEDVKNRMISGELTVEQQYKIPILKDAYEECRKHLSDDDIATIAGLG